MNIVYLGSSHFGLPCLEALLAADYGLPLVVTQTPHPAGRGRRPSPTPVAEWAASHGIPLIETDDVNTPGMIESIAGRGPEVLVVIAFGQKIGTTLVNLPARGAINVHASLLPRWRGAAPINRAIMAGDLITGVSIITLADRMDAGHILAQDETPIEPDETAGDLHDRLALLAAPLLISTLDQVQHAAAVYRPQDESQVTLARKLKKSDGYLDFGDAAADLARRIRGLWPWPGATADYLARDSGRCVRVTIASAEVVEGRPSLAPGTLDDRLCVACGQGALRIAAIKPAGSALMEFKDFVNGRRTKPGDAFIQVQGLEP
jgi:methionyl-tRNA formyltransferase